ncbi:MAG: endonuclease [Acidimicrobiales bacterium]
MTAHRAPTEDRIVGVLLSRHGRTFAAEAGIRLRRNTPAPLFQLLCLSLLVSARISAGIAVAAARALFEAGWTTADKMVAATWEERTRVLNRSGYARYDESTSTYLASTASLVVERYGGDLRRMRVEADGDLDHLRSRLTDCKGIGGVGADVFVREVQSVWLEYAPFVDDRTLGVATTLGLPSSATGLRAMVDDAGTFARLVAALVRTGLERDQDSILEEAGAR